MLPEAIAAARAGGPAVLLLPKDVQQGFFDGDVEVQAAKGRIPVDEVDVTTIAAAIKRRDASRAGDHHRRRTGGPRRRAA